MVIRYRLEANVSRMWGMTGWVTIAESSSIWAINQRVEEYIKKGFRNEELEVQKVILA